MWHSRTERKQLVMRRTLYGPDHEAFRESAREFVNRNILPVAEKLIDQRFIDREIWLEAGRNGFLGLEIPEQYGGSEAGDYRFNAVLGEELSRASAAVASSFGIHADVVAPYLVQLTTEEQKQRWLPKFCTGEMLTAIGMTEPSGGSDLAALKTTAVKDGDDWIINGSKTFITNGYNADLVIVAARTSPEKKSKGITLFAVESGMEGFERGRKLDKVGQHESDTAELFFENVRVPATRREGRFHCPAAAFAASALHQDAARLGRHARVQPGQGHRGHLGRGLQPLHEVPARLRALLHRGDARRQPGDLPQAGGRRLIFGGCISCAPVGLALRRSSNG